MQILPAIRLAREICQIKRAGAELRVLARGPGGRLFTDLPAFLVFPADTRRFLDAITLAGDGDDLSVMQEPVEEEHQEVHLDGFVAGWPVVLHQSGVKSRSWNVHLKFVRSAAIAGVWPCAA